MEDPIVAGFREPVFDELALAGVGAGASSAAAVAASISFCDMSVSRSSVVID